MLHGCIMQLFSRFVLVLVDGRYGHGLRKWPGVVQDLHMLWTSPIPSSDTMHGTSVIDLIYCLSAYLVLILHQQHRTSGDCRAKLWWLYCPELPRSKQAGRGKPNYVFPETTYVHVVELDPCKVLDRYVASCAESKGGRPVLTLVPQDTMSEFWLPLNAFDLSKGSKCGCAGCQTKFVFWP